MTSLIHIVSQAWNRASSRTSHPSSSWGDKPSPIRSIGERLAPIATFCSSGATRRTTTWHGIRQAMQTAWLQERAPAT